MQEAMVSTRPQLLLKRKVSASDILLQKSEREASKARRVNDNYADTIEKADFEQAEEGSTSLGTQETYESDSDSSITTDQSFSITSCKNSYDVDDLVGVRLVTPCTSAIDLRTHHDAQRLSSQEDALTRTRARYIDTIVSIPGDGIEYVDMTKPSNKLEKISTNKMPNTANQVLWMGRMRYLFPLALLVSVAMYCFGTSAHPPLDAIYVPGAGFSGFWFTLGRLRSIEDPASKQYYCFSAGCLGVVASLRNFTVDEMTDIAYGIQKSWKSGEIDRYDVVGEFVDSLVSPTSALNPSLRRIEDSSILDRIHIITSVKDNHLPGLVKAQIRSPRTTEELREMLIQTTWIPFAVGHSLWHTDSITGTEHMDGAFSYPYHPKVSHSLGLPYSLDIFMNVINVNLGRDKVKKFWNAGLVHGI